MKSVFSSSLGDVIGEQLVHKIRNPVFCGDQ